MITSTGNAVVKAARKLQRRSGRDGRSVLVEGPAAVASSLPRLRRLFVTAPAAAEHAALVDRARSAGAEVSFVADDVMAALADTVTPPGLVGVATLDDPGLGALDGARFVVVCHQVRDPGNAGAVVRTADATGADVVVLTSGSADVTAPKVARASAGSLFHLPVVRGVALQDVVAACHERGVQVVGAAADGDALLWDVDLAAPTALLFGNEAHGLGPSALRACDVVARFPLHQTVRAGGTGTAESLNLAATVAVFAAEVARRRARDEPARRRARVEDGGQVR